MEQRRCENPGCRVLLVPGSDYCTNCGTAQLPVALMSATDNAQPRRRASRWGWGVALAAAAALGIWGFVTVTGDGQVAASAGSANTSQTEPPSPDPAETETAAAQSGSQHDADEESAAERAREPSPEQSDGPDPDWTMYPVSAYTYVSVRVAPSRDGRKLGRIRRGELVHIVCLIRGEPVVDHQGDTIWNWDWIDYPITGYVPDAFVNTGGSPPPVPTC